jgi:AcrR family transcriptional regulator
MLEQETKHGQLGRPKDEGLATRRRTEILRHAIAHFARSGFADADLDAIAADVGCAKGTIYRYFENKEDLFHRAVHLVMDELLAATLASPSDDPLEQLEHGIRSYLAYFDAHPEYVELLIQERAVFPGREKATYFEHKDANRGRWLSRFEEMMAGGTLRRMPVERALDVIGDLLYGTIFTNYFAGRRKTLGQQVADVLDVLFHGLLTPQEASRRVQGRAAGGALARTGENAGRSQQ